MKEWLIYFITKKKTFFFSVQQHKEEASDYWNALCIDSFFKALYPTALFYLTDSAQWTLSLGSVTTTLHLLNYGTSAMISATAVAWHAWVSPSGSTYLFLDDLQKPSDPEPCCPVLSCPLRLCSSVSVSRRTHLHPQQPPLTLKLCPLPVCSRATSLTQAL